MGCVFGAMGSIWREINGNVSFIVIFLFKLSLYFFITPRILQNSGDSTSAVMLRNLRLTEKMCSHHGSEIWVVTM